MPNEKWYFMELSWMSSMIYDMTTDVQNKYCVELSADNPPALIPKGLAHGFSGV